MLKHYAHKLFFAALDHITRGTVSIRLPDGRLYHFSGQYPGACAELTIHDARAIEAFIQKGDIGFAETYRNGWWDTQDVTELLIFGLQNEVALSRCIYGSLLARLASGLAYFFTRNTLSGSKKNIHAHYDLGNDFYALWLDPTMTYSSALFRDDLDDSETLVQAQHRKYDRIIHRLSDSGRLLEIGCGWGGFAERALMQKDYAIKGLTISEAQYDYAVRRLGKNAQIVLEDYRKQQGKYDHIVSIEMFEAVGEKFWPVYFRQIKSLLAKRGKALVQTITIDDQYFERYRRSGDAIRSLIFPGGMLPSLERFIERSSQFGLRVTDQFAFGQHYAVTLKRWLEGFEQQKDKIQAMGFDDAFMRIWRFYLSFCIAGFTLGRTNVMQIELESV